LGAILPFSRFCFLIVTFVCCPGPGESRDALTANLQAEGKAPDPPDLSGNLHFSRPVPAVLHLSAEGLTLAPGFRGIIGLMNFQRRLSAAKLALLAVTAVAAVALLRTDESPAASSPSDAPQYTAEGRLVLPPRYREWIYLSSGLGMEYSAEGKPGSEFTNVFVKPSAYRAFLSSGRWPDRTVFVLEARNSATRGSINRGGHYQSGLRSLAASVKDVNRFPKEWAYFSFDQGAQQAAANAPSHCFHCHNTHGAVDNTFVQFYPTLKPVAEKHGRYNQAKADANR
jgi:Cytochrome P460